MIKYLTYFDVRIYPYRLNTRYFQSPITRKTHISETGGDMYIYSQTSDRRSAFEHRDMIQGFGIFDGSAEIHDSGLEHQALGRNRDGLGLIFNFHVQYMRIVYQQFVM